MKLTDNHQYKEDGMVLTSVTQLIDEFVPEFEEDQISKAVANRDNREQEDVLAEWELKREISSHYGDAFHQAAELWIKYDEMPKQIVLQKFIDSLEDCVDRDSCKSEKMVYDNDLGVAGTLDIQETLSEADSDSQSKEVRLLDIKTNTEFEKSYDKMLEPFEEYKSNKINKYKLQLNIYKELLERMEDVEVKEMIILKVEFDEDLEMSINCLEVEEMEEDLISIIEDLDLKVEDKEEKLIEKFV